MVGENSHPSFLVTASGFHIVLSFNNDSFSLIETDLKRYIQIRNGLKVKELGNLYVVKTQQHQIDQQSWFVQLEIKKLINPFQKLFSH